MENYKIRVNSKAESKEAQELFVVLGAVCCSGLERNKNVNFLFMNSGFLTACKLQENFDKSKCKEITLPELRDLVVLKRNDIEDATHESPCGELKFILLGDWWNLFTGGKWQQFSHKQSPRCNKLKPIEKPMKEYLRKNSNGTYSYIGTVQPDHVSNFMIEIPEGSETFNYYDRKDNLFFLKGSGEDTMFSNDLNDWDWKHWGNIDFDGVVCLWSCHTNPEELPFIDDEPLKVIDSEYSKDGNSVTHTVSLNDQYAEIEKVRQSAWQKQEGGNHYKNLKIQPMQYALENKLDYAQANVVKYVTRHADKNGKEDLLKAIHNIELMIEFYYGDEK